MPEDKRTRDDGVADVDNGESILIIKTFHGLLVLNLNGNQNGYKRCRDEPAVVLKIIDFESNGLPTDMGVMRLGYNRFFMFGGRKYGKISIPGWVKKAYTYIKMKSVYKLNPDNDWSLELTEEVNQPAAPKILPLVEEVNGKIFVLQDIYFFRHWDNPHPIFEVYDRTLNTWKEIPTQKIWSKEEEAIIKSRIPDAAIFVGCRMYIALTDKDDEKKKLFFCFNASTYEWEEKNASKLRDSFQKCRVNFPNFGVCVSGIDNLEDNLNVILYKDQNETMSACLIDDLGSLVCYQQLSPDLYFERDISRYNGGASLVNHKSGGGRMCLVINGRDDDEEKWVIFIRHFELKVKEDLKEEVKKLSDGVTFPVEMEFLTYKIYKDQRCRLTDDQGGSSIGLRDAFFL